MNIILPILLGMLFVILPLGDITRLQFNNGIAISALDAIAGLIFILIIIQYTHKKTYLETSLFIPTALFIGVCVLSLLVNIPSLNFFQFCVSALYIVRFVSYSSIYIFIARLDQKMKRHIPYFLAGSGFFFVVCGFVQYFLFPNLKSLFHLGWDEHYLRLFSTFFDPNFAGVFLVLYFLFLLDIFLKLFKGKKNTTVILLVFMLLTTCLAIFFTLSRDSFIALAISLFTYLLLQRTKNRFSIFGIVMVLLAISIFFLRNLPTEGAHMLRIPSSIARIDQAQRAFTIFSEHPVLGVGFNAYRYAQFKRGYLGLTSWQSSHAAAGTDTSFLFVLATTGIIGFTAYCYLLYKMSLFALQRKSEFSVLAFSSLVALVVSSFFINSLFYAPFLVWMWILFGLIENFAGVY